MTGIASGQEAAVALISAKLEPLEPLAASVIDVIITAGLAAETLDALAEAAIRALEHLAKGATVAVGHTVTPRMILEGDISE